MAIQFTGPRLISLEQQEALCHVLAAGLLRWHKLRIAAGNLPEMPPRRLEVGEETVLSVVTPEHGAGDSETLEKETWN